MHEETLKLLENYLGVKRSSEIDAMMVGEYLSEIWESLNTPQEGGLKACKLRKLLENLKWEPPILMFDIERHGAFMLGSRFGEIQSWHIDVIALTAKFSAGRKRRLEPQGTKIDVSGLADEVVMSIIGERQRVSVMEKRRIG